MRGALLGRSRCPQLCPEGHPGSAAGRRAAVPVGRVRSSPFPHGLLPRGRFVCWAETKAPSHAVVLLTPVTSAPQVGDGGRPPPPAQLGEDELLLLAFRVRILRLFDRLRGCLSFPSNEQWDKIKPPAYLITQTLKILQLCTTSDVSDELRSSVRAIVNAQV